MYPRVQNKGRVGTAGYMAPEVFSNESTYFHCKNSGINSLNLASKISGSFSCQISKRLFKDSCAIKSQYPALSSMESLAICFTRILLASSNKDASAETMIESMSELHVNRSLCNAYGLANSPLKNAGRCFQTGSLPLRLSFLVSAFTQQVRRGVWVTWLQLPVQFSPEC